MKITLTTTHLEKTGKVTYKPVDTEVTEIIEEQYNNMVESKKFFKRLGGKESHTKNYTCRGYKVVKIKSTSPCGQFQTIRNFEFD